MRVRIDRASKMPIYRQIEQQLRSLILEGQLPQGRRLPSERELARHLGVNRTTVVNAYRELAADGLVEGHVGRGTIVSSPTLPISPRTTTPEPLRWAGLIRARNRGVHLALTRHVARLAAQPDTISLAGGVPGIAQSPALDLEQAIEHVSQSGNATLLSDSPIEGLSNLREELARRLLMKGCGNIPSSHIFVVSGAQQGLYLLARLLLQPGEAVLVESPTYLGALEVFRTVGARLVSVPVDDQGMHVETVEGILANGRIRLIYTIPNFQNPTGSTLSAERRKVLLQLAQRYRVPILEDDLYGELFYDALPPVPIKALDNQDYVVYSGSLSPVLGSGLRLGWLAVPPAIAEPLTALRQAIDLHPSTFIQALVHELLVAGAFDSHVEWLRETFRRRRDAMCGQMKAHMPSGVTWKTPEGGLYIWCSLPEGIISRVLLEEAANEGVVFAPGEMFFPHGGGEGFMRLNFADLPEEDAEEGIARLAKAISRLKRHLKPRVPSTDAIKPVV